MHSVVVTTPNLQGAANEIVDDKTGEEVGLNPAPLQLQLQALPLQATHLNSEKNLFSELFLSTKIAKNRGNQNDTVDKVQD
jgi:hypothetical protein